MEKLTCTTCGIELTEGAVYRVAYNPYCPEHASRANWEHCRWQISRLVDDGLLRPGFPGCEFSKSDPTAEALNPECWRSLREWDRKTNLFLFGTVGSGKTFGARCVLYAELWRGRRIAEIASGRLSIQFDQFNDGGLLDKLTGRDVLLIDDLDKGLWRPRALRALFELLDVRREAGRATFVTSNLHSGKLRDLLRAQAVSEGVANDSLADATLDRLKPVLALEFKGASIR